MLDGGSSVGYWRHGKSPDIFCRIRERGCMCCSRWRCGTRRRCEMQRRRSSACCAYRCERDAARRGRPREDRAARGLFCGAFCAGNLLGLGVATALLAAVAFVGGVPVARLLREGAFAYPIVGFLLVYNVAASGWLAGIAVALRLLLLVWASLLLMALSTPAELSEGCAACSPFGSLGPARTRLRDIAFHRSAVHAAAFRGAESRESRPGSRGAAFEDAARATPAGLRGAHGAGARRLFRRADRLAAAMERDATGPRESRPRLSSAVSPPSDGAVLLVALPPVSLSRSFPRGSQRARRRPRWLSGRCAIPGCRAVRSSPVASRALPVPTPARLRGWRRK